MSKSRSVLPIIAGLAILAATPAVAGLDESAQDRQMRWNELKAQIFPGKSIEVDDKAVQLDAPPRALDAALVPIAISATDPARVKAFYLVIDDNPSPVAAHVVFGSEALPRELKLRVRINAYTNVHAIVETTGGKLVETTKFVKASGGCSAPMGVSDEEAMQGIGDMRLKLAGDVETGKPVGATLMVRHPNFNGMQMNATTRDYTPARYIRTVNVRFGGKRVFDLESDISLASNPVIGFELLPSTGKGTVEVKVQDSQNDVWAKNFEVPPVAN